VIAKITASHNAVNVSFVFCLLSGAFAMFFRDNEVSLEENSHA
jgi:hypothetical protein